MYRIQREPSGHRASLRQHLDGNVKRSRNTGWNVLSDRHRNDDQTWGSAVYTLCLLAFVVRIVPAHDDYRTASINKIYIVTVTANLKPIIVEKCNFTGSAQSWCCCWLSRNSGRVLKENWQNKTKNRRARLLCCSAFVWGCCFMLTMKVTVSCKFRVHCFGYSSLLYI